MVVGALLTIIGVVSLITRGEPDTVAVGSTTTVPPTTGPTVTVAPSTTTSTTTTTTTPTTTTEPPETPEEFLALLVQGLREDPEFLVSRLNQATIDIYGAEQCLATFTNVLDPDTTFEIREIGEVGPWDYVIDDIVTPLEDILAIEVERFVAGQTIIQELHWRLVDGLWTWFSDCGEPLAG